MLTLIHVAKSLRTIFQTYKVSVATDAPMREETREGSKRANSEKVLRARGASATSTRLYMGRELNKEGPDVGMILVDLEGKEYSHDVCLNFYASKDNMDYEALLEAESQERKKQRDTWKRSWTP
ncbi:hypothetical protein Tco_1354401 [Tanacetum coccineum]